MTDIEINRSVKARPIQDVANQLGILEGELLPYGRLKAKVSLDVLERLHAAPLGRYVLVTAINPTPLGEGKTLQVDSNRITWPRTLGVSDRALRQILLGEGTASRPGRFVITEASEVMAMLALASSQADLRHRLGQIVVGVTMDGLPVRAEEFGCAGSMAVLLRDALLPNLVQTLEGTAAFVHTGPFGNIAHGNCSILSDAIALRCADYVVTEAGFGSDLGAEKFFNIKCRLSGFKPAAAVVVATLRALKLHGGGGAVMVGAPLPAGLTGPDQEAVVRGFANLEQHIANVKAHGVPVVVAVNAFIDDPVAELEWVREL